MKRLLTLILACFCLTAGAQNEALIKSLAKEGSLSCKFALSEKTASNVIISGKAWIQDSSYRVESETFQIMSDGKNRWFYSPDKDELVIEKNSLSILDNPVEKLADGSYRMTIKTDATTFIVTVTDLVQKKEKYPFEYFMMDPEKISLDTIVTDLR